MSAAVANALEEGTDCKQSVQNLGQPSAGLGTVCTALGRHSVNSAAVGSWWFGDFFFFFPFRSVYSRELGLGVEWALSLLSLGVGESVCFHCLYFHRVVNKGRVKVCLGKVFGSSFPLLAVSFICRCYKIVAFPLGV